MSTPAVNDSDGVVDEDDDNIDDDDEPEDYNVEEDDDVSFTDNSSTGSTPQSASRICDAGEPSTSRDSRKRKIEDSSKETKQTKITKYFHGSSSNFESPPTPSVETSNKKDEKLDKSFYKLRWFTFEKYKDTDVEHVIKATFKPPENGKWTLEIQPTYKKNGFFIVACQRRKNTQAAKMLPIVKRKENTTHDVLIFFFTEEINPKHAFCMCSGASHTLLEGHTESKFSKTIAKLFMDGNCIISKEVICIAGPSIAEKQTFSPEVVMLITGNYEKIITGLTAEIRKGTALDEILCEKDSVSMTLGQKKLKINKTLDQKTFLKVLKLFVKVEESPDNFTSDPVMAAALDHTKVIGDPDEIQHLDGKLMEEASKSTEQSGVYLSHRKIDDWVHSSDVKLTYGKETQDQWTLTPTLATVRRTCETQGKHLDDSVQISFIAKDRTHVKGKLKDFLHGSIVYDGNQYHKVAGKWFWLSVNYRSLLVNRIAVFLNSNLIKQENPGYLPLPWKPKTLPEIPDTLKFLSEFTRADLLDLLKNEKVVYLGDDGKACLTGLNCKFIERTDVFAELKKCLSTKTNQRDVSAMITGIGHALMISEETESPLPDCLKSCSMNKEQQTFLENHIEKVVAVLQEDRKVIDSDDAIVNPYVTKRLLKTIFEALPKHIKTKKCTPEVVGNELLCYLTTSCRQINEDAYNETYQVIPQQDDGSCYLLGDRVMTGVLPELFDILYYTTEGRLPAKLYLYHVKEGFGQKTRDACSQIRVSGNLLWQDLMDSSCELPNLMKYRRLALDYHGDDISRITLKRVMENMSEEKFKSMFRNVAEICFVYAFMDGSKTDNFLDGVSSLGKLTRRRVDAEVLRKMKDRGFVDRDGTLTDSFFLKTKDEFIKQMYDKDGIPKKQLKNVYDQIFEQTKPNLSTIALVELMTLAEEFTKFQCPARRFSFKVCQISTCRT